MSKNIKSKIGVVIILVFAILLINTVIATYTDSSPQLTQFNTFAFDDSNKFDSTMCQEGTDFLVQIAPFGCTPIVVRSDLLEEQEVPVFCSLAATQINPLIDVESISSISFQGQFPKEVSGIGFYPAKAALSTQEKLNYPILDNIGYVIIKLKKQKNESSMPDFVQGNLTADIKYDIKGALGIGPATFYLPQISDDAEWERNSPYYSFWGKRGYLRAIDIDTSSARVVIYDKDLKKISSINLVKGQESSVTSFPGFDCLAGFTLKLESTAGVGTRARLEIDSDVVEVVKGESFLDNRCRLRDLDKKGLVQRVELSCREDENGFLQGKPFILTIAPRITLKIENNKRNVSLGDYLYDSNDPNKFVYLGYIGTRDMNNKEKNSFVYLVELPEKKERLSNEELASISRWVRGFAYEETGNELRDIVAGVSDSLTKELSSLINFFRGKSAKYLIYGEDREPIFGKKVSIIGFSSPEDKELNQETITNYQKAIDDFDEIFEQFSQEKYKRVFPKTTLGEEALYEKINLMYDLNKKESMFEVCRQFKEEYPVSEKDLTICEDAYKLSSSGIETVYVLINGKSTKISFKSIQQPTKDDYSAEVLIKGPAQTKSITLAQNEVINLQDFRGLDREETIELISLDEDSAIVNINVRKKAGNEYFEGNNKKLELNSPQTFGDYTFTLQHVNLKRAAKVTLAPKISKLGSKANFGFKIGIEKRAKLLLTPDIVKERIKNLNKSISKWEKSSQSLGKAIEVGRTACLATGGVLVFKNFLEAFDGRAIARNTVMRSKGGWYERCADLVNAGTYISQEKCLKEESDNIERDVDALEEIMKAQNEELKQLQAEHPGQKTFLQDTVDSQEFFNEYCQKVAGEIGTLGTSYSDPYKKGDDIDIANMKNILCLNKDTESLRAIELYTKVKSSDASDKLKGVAQKELYSELLELQVAHADNAKLKTALERYGFGEGQGSYGSTQKLTAEIPVTTLKTYKDVMNNFVIDTPYVSSPEFPNPNDYVYYFKDQSDNREYLLVLGSDYVVKETYLINNGVLVKEEKENPLLLGFKKYDEGAYKNEYKNYEARFYETEPYKGMPAIVPFDVKNGWYAATKPTLPALGKIRSYDESGGVSSYWLCNVGNNGLEEFNSLGDDICQMINLRTGQAYDQFKGLSKDEAAKRIKAGEDAIMQAASQYTGGKKEIRISVGYGEIRMRVGKPAVSIPEVQCEDFMSPKDCLLLFNVCDPVVCPSSRCDLGGTYPVKDVIQSGIIGSIALCFPNIREGIIVPICLPGIKAGMDGIIEAQKLYRDCLQTSLDTGQMVGICDEIHSLYMCDFFWRQLLPVAKLTIPKILSALFGQGARGGGEYLSIQSAWESAGKSADLFVGYYGESMSKAFKFRTAEEFLGDQICKYSPSVVYPSGADFLGSITASPSPPQFHGRFDEIPFTTVTVPPRSQYKVFYMIYAGKDSGAYYRVYLEGETESYYQDTSQSRVVAAGFIPAGKSASNTTDFLAPSGYKRLCIVVNGQEECGFKQVSTSFAIDYLEESYVVDYVNTNKVKSEKECVSGSVNPYLLNPNLAEAIEETVNPEIYNKGIIRICATDNPGEGTDPNLGFKGQRWLEVGYCDNTQIKCWLDTQSVKDVLDFQDLEKGALGDIQDDYLEALKKEKGYVSDQEFESEVKGIKGEKNPGERIKKIGELINKVWENNHKAYLLLLRGKAYVELALESYFSNILKLSSDKLEPSEKESEEYEEEGKSEAGETPTERSYILNKIGFSINGDELLEGTAKKDSNEDVISLVVKGEGNCDKAIYQVFVPIGGARWVPWGGHFLQGDYPKTKEINKENMNKALNELLKGEYYVMGYCYKGEKIVHREKSNELLIEVDESDELPDELIKRYEPFKGYFEKYSAENLPSGWDPKTFKALLVAIAQRQSELGYPQGEFDPRWLMEYGWRIENEKITRYGKYICEEGKSVSTEKVMECAKTQVKDASESLKITLGGKAENEIVNKLYYPCDRRNTNRGVEPEKDERLKCVLSVYLTGELDTKGWLIFKQETPGAKYADQVIELMKKWKIYFKKTDSKVQGLIDEPPSATDEKETSVQESLVGNGIWQTAKDFFDRKDWSEYRLIDVNKPDTESNRDYIDICTRFIIHVMWDAGVRTNGITYTMDLPSPSIENMDNLISLMESSGDFKEIDFKNEALQKGDIIFLGYHFNYAQNPNHEKCDLGMTYEQKLVSSCYENTQHAIIFDSYKDDKTIYAYGDTDDTSAAKTLVQYRSFGIYFDESDRSDEAHNYYIHRAFRFVGELKPRESAEISQSATTSQSAQTTSSSTSETTLESAESVNFISPVFRYDDGRWIVGDLSYKYSKNKWYWSSNEKKWVEVRENPSVTNQENKEFTESLQKKSYLEGLNLLMERTVREEETKDTYLVVTGATEMDSTKEFYRIDKNRYFKFLSGRWKWRVYGGDWRTGTSLAGSSSELASLIKVLEGKDFINGARILFEY